MRSPRSFTLALLILGAIAAEGRAATAVGASEVVTATVTAGLIRAGSEIDSGATEYLVLGTQSAIGAHGGGIQLKTASGTPPLLGPFQPADGGSIALITGDGSDEAGGADAGNGGDISLTAGSGGDDGGSGSTGATGDGGSIWLIPGHGGQELGGGGGQGLDGVVVLADPDTQPQLTVERGNVRLLQMLQLAVRSDAPTCGTDERGSVFVRADGGGGDDSLCVCLFTSGSGYVWVDLVAGAGCP